MQSVGNGLPFERTGVLTVGMKQVGIVVKIFKGFFWLASNGHFTTLTLPLRISPVVMVSTFLDIPLHIFRF